MASYDDRSEATEETPETTADDLRVDLNQGRDGQNRKFGYVTDENGGYFFTWLPTLEETLDSLDADEIDAPEFPLEMAREVLRARIASRFDS